MPARVSRSSLPSSAPKQARKKNKSKKRSLNAFAIAEAAEPERHRIRRTRLGEVEDDEPRFKRSRGGSDEEEEEEPASKKRHRGGEDEDISESDGEGNRWRTGVVDEDDDSDIDSEEAFGSSDEERFEGWTFRGGSSRDQSGPKAKRTNAAEEDGDLNLNENQAEESDDDSLGSGAVDLATMLDNYEDSEDENGTDGGDESGDQGPPSNFSMSDDEGNDLDKAAQLQSLVSKLQPELKAEKKPREIDFHESKAPSASGVVSSDKFDINDFLASTSDPQLKKLSREIGTLPKDPKKDLKLAPALPKRQKDRLDRIVANERAKETLERWVDTVKHQRRAEHLSFPLVDPDTAVPSGSKVLLPTSQSRPFNDLESTIANIMQESGLTSGRHGEEESKLLEFEELKTNKMPIEEVLARRAELRKARDLLFREEIRAKRIKKIKSKAFRRIKRKEREKLAALDRDAFREGWDSDMNEEERDEADRKRAEERMSLKHKDSKWSKQMKKSGRMAWDDEAMAGMTEMARKNEELKRRIEGKAVRDSDVSGDEILSSSEEDEGSDVDDDDAIELQRLQRQMNRAQEYGETDESASKLHSLKFMREAEERRKKENQEAIEQMRRELVEQGSGSDDGREDETIGRKIFAPTKPVEITPKSSQVRGEFEERDDSDEDEGVEILLDTEHVSPPQTSKATRGQTDRIAAPSSAKVASSSKKTSNAINQLAKTKPETSAKPSKTATTEPSAELLTGERHSQPDADGWVTVSYDHEEESEADVEANNGILSQTEILRRAFAADDVEDAFEAEKNADISDEDEKVIDETLPGWGSWVGDGLSKREKAKNKNRKLVTQAGIKRDERKDRNLQGVIINQKRVRKNAVYLADSLPHEFGTKREYEGSMRMPLGGEWNTRSILKANIKPRVVVKPGAIVKPMSKPLV